MGAAIISQLDPISSSGLVMSYGSQLWFKGTCVSSNLLFWISWYHAPQHLGGRVLASLGFSEVFSTPTLSKLDKVAKQHSV